MASAPLDFITWAIMTSLLEAAKGSCLKLQNFETKTMVSKDDLILKTSSGKMARIPQRI